MGYSIANTVLDARFMMEAYRERNNSSLPTNPILQHFDAAAENAFGDTFEVKIFPATSQPAPTNRLNSPAKVLQEIGGQKRYYTPITAFNEMYLDANTLMYLEQENNPAYQEMGREELNRQIDYFKQRHTLLRMLGLSKALFGGQIFRDVDGNITETSSTGPTVDLGVPATRKSQLNVLGGNIISAAWDVASTKILTQIDQIKIAAEELGVEAPTDIWLHSTAKRWLRDNDEIRAYFQNKQLDPDPILTGSMYPNLGGLNWHFFDGSYTDSSGTTRSFFPKTMAVLTPPVTRGGWFRAMNGSTRVRTSGAGDRYAADAASITGGSEIVYGDFFYAKEVDNPDTVVIRGGTKFLYAFANPNAIWMPTVDF